jgi:hypothetical protein
MKNDPKVIFWVTYSLHFKKNQDLKVLGFFCKVIPKSLRFGCNAWSKSNIYNINNNIKLGLTVNIKVSELQYQTQ